MNELVPVGGNRPSGREFFKKLVLDSVSSEHSRRAYGFALDEFFSWYGAGDRGPFRKAIVQEYRVHLEALGFAASTPQH